MPARPLRPCTTPGCTNRTTTGRCPTCTARRHRTGHPGTHGYGRRWAATRLQLLTDHPWCALCGRQATIADHHPTSRRDLIAAGDPDPDHPRHLRPLCKPCHDRYTAHAQPGGWHREQQRRTP